MIHVSCPSCQAPYDLDERRMPASGMRMRCPKCGSSFQVSPSGETAAADAPAAPKRAPLAPAFPSTDLGDLDLPAPKQARKPAFDELDLPAPKGAPRLDELDLPAPKQARPAAPVRDAFDELDLPAPKVGGRAADLELDLPAPKVGGAGRGAAAFDLDLPAPKKPVSDPFGGLDLPAAKPVRGAALGDLDLPAPKAAAAFPDLDLPAPKAKVAPPFPDLDLPAPKQAAAKDLLDLPGPAKGFTDLPAAKPAGKITPAFDALDLPMPKGDRLDLPAPKVGGVLDLPTPKGGDLDLPAAKGEFDLPAPRASAPKPPARAPGPPPAPPKATPAFGDLDLGPPPAKTRGAALGDFDLDTPQNDAGAKGGAGLDLGLDLDLPPARPRGAPQAPEKRTGGALFSDPPPADTDALDLPPARARGAETADGRKGAGGAAFGELDLGGSEDFEGLGEDLEFGGIPQASGSHNLPGLDDAPPALVQSSERDQAARREESKAQATTARKKRFRGALTAIFASALLLGAVGFALRYTKYGNFGIYFLERFMPAAKGGDAVRGAITRADASALEDTYTSTRRALDELGRQRREYGLDRTLLVRSLLHESLYIVRFGADSRAGARIGRIVTRLDERSNDAPGVELALAAYELSRGVPARARIHLGRAQRESANDPFFHIVDGETALAEGRFERALSAFERARGKGGRGRAAWGIARALIAQDDARAAAAIDATLTASPEHVEARVAKARREFDAGDLDGSLALARVAAGMSEVAGKRLHAGPAARASALVLVGTIEERRGHRAEARTAYEAAVAIDGYDLAALVGAGRVLMLESMPREALVRLGSAIQVAEAARPGNDAERARVAALLREARLTTVRALLDLERAQDALPIVNALIAQTPDDSVVLLAQGRVAEALHENERAETSYRGAIEKAPTSFDGYLALSQLYFAMNRADDAARVLADAETHVQITADVRRAKGESELRRNDMPAAIREFRGAIELDPNDRASMFGLGVAQRRSNDLAGAQATFDRLAAIDATYPGLALERGLVFEARGDAAEAVRSYTRALESRPNDYELMTRLGGAQVAAELVEDAQRTLRVVLDHQPGNPLALHYMGRAEFQRGRLREAVTLLQRAVALDPQRAEFRVYLAWALLDDNDLGGAQSQISEALERDPSIADAYWIRARLYARTGRAQEGLLDAAQALQRNPNRVDAWSVIGDCQEQLGRRADAIVAYQRAVAGRATVGEWWYKLGRLQIDSGRAAEAITSLTRAAELVAERTPKPGWLPDAYRALGDGLAARGDRAGAIQSYRHYLEVAAPGAIDRPTVQRALADLGG